MNEVDDELQMSRRDGSPLRSLPPESLQESLEAHQVWVRSRGSEGSRADLSEANLGRVNLRVGVLMEANLKGANLERAILEGARMQRAELQGASLRGADLQRVSLHQANLQGADLFEANLAESGLPEANLQAVNLLEANLQRANLQRANLQRAFMKGAMFQGADLQGSNMHGANLQEAGLAGADLRRAVLREANLTRANLRGADLHGTELQGCNFLDAHLQQAYLRDADLRDTTGLVVGQLGGADLAGAKLPQTLSAFEGVHTVREMTLQARRLLMIGLLGCLASWLCIGFTTDAMIVTNAPIALFPDLAVPVPSAIFYRVMPILLLGLFIYLHLHLQRLWEELAGLPAVFPDGRTLDRVVHPWLLNSQIRLYSSRLREQHVPLSRLQTAAGTLMAWWLIPLSLLLFWVRYLPRQHWGVTLLHIATLVIGLAFMVLFRNLARQTLRGGPVRRYRHGAAAVMTALLSNVLLSLISLGALTGVPPDLYRDQVASGASSPQLAETDMRRLVPFVLTLLGASPFADLVEVDVSRRPAQSPDATALLELVHGAPLKQGNLRYARAQNAFLVNADLREAILLGADLRHADLRGARLDEADLRGAVLFGADLRHCTGLTLDQLAAALTDSTTRLPRSLDVQSTPTIER